MTTRQDTIRLTGACIVLLSPQRRAQRQEKAKLLTKKTLERLELAPMC
jgi:hypothetical protein